MCASRSGLISCSGRNSLVGSHQRCASALNFASSAGSTFKRLMSLRCHHRALSRRSAFVDAGEAALRERAARRRPRRGSHARGRRRRRGARPGRSRGGSPPRKVPPRRGRPHLPGVDRADLALEAEGARRRRASPCAAPRSRSPRARRRATAFASSAAVRISVNRSRRLLLAAPSVPRPTLTPRARSAATGAMPLASFRFDDGQCATLAPSRASSSSSTSSRCTACTAIEPRAHEAQAAQALERAHAVLRDALRDLVARLVHVRVDRQVELLGEHRDALQRLVAHGVGRVRREAEGEQRLAAVGVARREALGEVAGGVGRVGAGKLDRDHAEAGAHARRAAPRAPWPRGRSTCRSRR